MGGPFASPPPYERERNLSSRSLLTADLAKKAINFAFAAFGKNKPFELSRPKEGVVVASPLTDSIETEEGTFTDHGLRKNLSDSSNSQDPYLN